MHFLNVGNAGLINHDPILNTVLDNHDTSNSNNAMVVDSPDVILEVGNEDENGGEDEEEPGGWTWRKWGGSRSIANLVVELLY